VLLIAVNKFNNHLQEEYTIWNETHVHVNTDLFVTIFIPDHYLMVSTVCSSIFPRPHIKYIVTWPT
jgi:hypothetical protein